MKFGVVSFKQVAASVAAAIGRANGSSWLLRRAALAPVAFKTPLFERTLSAIARRSRLGAGLIETNGGISDDLRLLLPPRKYGMLFGRPVDYEAERATLTLAQHLAQRSNAFLDVGANDGMFTFSIANSRARCSGSMHLFEPDPIVFARLTENLSRNRIEVSANNVAVGEGTGNARFYRNLTDDLSGSLTTVFKYEHEVVPIDVPVLALANYIVEKDISRACIKIDVEGAGLLVWEGMRIALDRIDWIVFEIIGAEAVENLPGRIVTETGWNAYYIRDFELLHSVKGEYHYCAPFYNWLFCPASPAELTACLAGTKFRVLEARPETFT